MACPTLTPSTSLGLEIERFVQVFRLGTGPFVNQYAQHVIFPGVKGACAARRGPLVL